MPVYQKHPSQPFTGNLPGMIAMGPPDLRASSGTAPHYQAMIDRQYTRQLAGIGAVQDENAQPVLPGTTRAQLDHYAEKDDVQGSGIFDPSGTQPNIHPDAGVFATRYGIPGYLARERMYHQSEVVDSTTGRPVVYVNGGAVSMDSAAQVAFLEKGAYRSPEAVIQAQEDYPTPDESTVNVRVNPVPIRKGVGAVPQTLSGYQGIAIAALLGVIAGAVYAVATEK